MSDLTERIETINSLLDLAGNDRRPGPRTAKQRAALKQATGLAEERDKLHGRLDRMWDWLDANPHDERHERRENNLLAVLKTYVSVCDALHRVQTEVLAG